MDVKSVIYNINLCRICQIPGQLDLLKTDTTTETGVTYLSLLKFIFGDILWIEDELISLACKTCLEKVTDIAEFKRLCLETNGRRGALTFDPIQVEVVAIKVEVEAYDEPEVVEIEPQHRAEQSLEKDQAEKKTKRKNKDLVKNNQRTKRKKKDSASDKSKATNVGKICRKKPLKRVKSEDTDENIENEHSTKTATTKGTRKKQIKLYVPEYLPNDDETNCRLCKKEFGTFQELEDHIKIDHIKLSFPCDSCQETFKSVASLKRHMFRHNGIRNFICTVCGKKFITSGDLCHHKQRHVAEPIFICDICPDKKFKSKDSLTKHNTIVHTDKKDYKYLCTECGRKFAMSSWLTEHMIRHNRIKKFRCHLCDKTFCTKKELMYHTSAHSNVRPFKCDMCPAEYKRRNYLLNHKLKVHGTLKNKLPSVERITLNDVEMSRGDATGAEAEPTDGASNKAKIKGFLQYC